MIPGFTALERYNIPWYLQSHRSGPARVSEYWSSLPRRWFDTACRLFVCFVKVSSVFTAVGAVVALIGHSRYDHRAARENFSSLGDLPERIELVDGDGRFFAVLPWGSTRRSILSVEELPPYLIDMLLTMEDRRFFSHGGVNWSGVVRAVAHDAKTVSLAHGGSGITQQLAKMWKFGVPKDETAYEKFDRKFLEWHLARRIEAKCTKNEILCLYLNRIDFGGGFHGIYAAAAGFFGKLPKDLTIKESATLVAILRGPGEYSPIKHPERTLARRNLVLRQVARIHPEVVSPTQAAQISAQPMTVELESWRKMQVPSAITILAHNELEQALGAEVLAKGGFRVTLTIDSKWNTAASEHSERHLRSIEARRGPSDSPLQASVVAIDSKSGEIRLMLPGRPSAGGQLNRVTQSRRDPGSAIKPFIYNLLFEQGIKLSDSIDAGPIRHGELGLGPPDYSPKNAGGTDGTITVQEALEKSVNTAAVRAGDKIGIEKFAAFLDRLGIAKDSLIPRSPAAFLGSFGVRPLDLAAGYTIFSNHGVRCPEPHIVRSVIDGSGAVVFSFGETGQLAVTPQAADKTAECLRGVMTRGTGRAAAALGLREPSLGKTGTTNDVKDVWFAGAAADVTCVVWIGFDKPKHILNAYAAQLALPLWVRVLCARPTKQNWAPIK